VISYTEKFKDEMVRRIMARPGISVQKLSIETGVAKSILYRWKEQKVKTAMTNKSDDKKRTGAEKLRLLSGAPLSEEEFGAMLRREGLHEREVESWRDAAAEALSISAEAPTLVSHAQMRTELSVAKKKVSELEKELHRKEKALAEAAALLLLEKKLQAIGWRNGAGSTVKKSDE
jgi:transposase